MSSYLEKELKKHNHLAKVIVKSAITEKEAEKNGSVVLPKRT